MEFTNDDIASLGDKLVALDLTDGEREALRTLIAISTEATGDDDEVAGFALKRTGSAAYLGGALGDENSTFKADFGSLGLKLGPPRRGIIMHEEQETI